MDKEQQSILRTLGVANNFEVPVEVRRRVDFLRDYLCQASCRKFVLAISGGVDLLAAGLLAQAAVSELWADGYNTQFIVVRFPYGEQADEIDAQKSLGVIGPDRVVTVEIKPAADTTVEAVMAQGEDLVEPARKHFHVGSIKARQRMIAEYALAGSTGGLVIGTGHAPEALVGYFTKFGDGAADILPLAGLTKRRVRSIAEHWGAPSELVFNVPTADLGSDAPLRPDEEVYGVSYEDIENFLEGKPVAEPTRQRILKTYRTSGRQRALPVMPTDRIAG